MKKSSFFMKSIVRSDPPAFLQFMFVNLVSKELKKNARHSLILSGNPQPSHTELSILNMKVVLNGEAESDASI